MEFSVLMSVYYKENPEYLKLALDSVIYQSIAPNQVVIVKDGALTQELDEIIHSYENAYPGMFTVVSLEQNLGLGDALNIGLKYCKYDLVARMDTDDIAASNRFERQLDEFRKNPRLALCGSYIQEFEGTIDNIVAYRKVPITNKEIYAYAKKRNPFNHMTVMFRKDAVLQAGNYNKMIGAEDYCLWVRMMQNGNEMKNIPEILVYARTGNDMIKRRGGVKYALNALRLQRYLYKIGFVSLTYMVMILLIKIIVALCPVFLRRYIYVNFLR